MYIMKFLSGVDAKSDFLLNKIIGKHPVFDSGGYPSVDGHYYDPKLHVKSTIIRLGNVNMGAAIFSAKKVFSSPT